MGNISFTEHVHSDRLASPNEADWAPVALQIVLVLVVSMMPNRAVDLRSKQNKTEDWKRFVMNQFADIAAQVFCWTIICSKQKISGAVEMHGLEHGVSRIYGDQRRAWKVT